MPFMKFLFARTAGSKMQFANCAALAAILCSSLTAKYFILN